LAVGAGIALSKPVEDIWKELWLYPDTRVAYHNFNVSIDPAREDSDAAIIRCELHCIREQIPKDLPQEATRDYTSSVPSVADKQFLRDLPTCACRQVDGQAFFLCHATPSDPLYEYRPPDSPLWERDEEASSGANVVLAGHTHLQFARAGSTSGRWSIPEASDSPRLAICGHDTQFGRTVTWN
jgi:diadenosine tetraphosphatase ApaH/serine/threonine PP2A family protein phosphatase